MSFQAGRPEEVHDDESMIAIHLKLTELQKCGMFQRLANFEFVFQDRFFYGVLAGVIQHHFHRQLHCSARFDNLPDLRRSTRSDAVAHFVFADGYWSFTHYTHS